MFLLARRYTWQDRSRGAIWQSIEWLDRQGMEAIESGQPEAFNAYQAQYRNTICGRHPIGVLLNMLQHAQGKYKIAFRCYEQSSQCKVASDSSVSYAAAVVTRAGDGDAADEGVAAGQADGLS